jgi:hypothetical protein
MLQLILQCCNLYKSFNYVKFTTKCVDGPNHADSSARFDRLSACTHSFNIEHPGCNITSPDFGRDVDSTSADSLHCILQHLELGTKH